MAVGGTHPALVAAMADPAFYPHAVECVEVVQTHISYIFLAGDFVYKVKKPVDFGFLNFTTLDLRRHFCLEELRLNRRLAPDMYLDVYAICADEAGGLQLGPSLVGPPLTTTVPTRSDDAVEYALKMRRLPEERMLKRLLPTGAVGLDTIEAIARKVARFHEEAETGGEVDRIGGVDSIRHNNTENFEQTEKYVGLTIPERAFRFIRAYDASFFARYRPLLEERVARGRVRDCHGDLHLEHICLFGGSDGITIFDCIEFNERFRYSDVACEVAFLFMDLDFNGYHAEAERFVDAYVAASGDEDVRLLLNFFACYRAYVRGKVISFRLDDPAIAVADREAARQVAGRYFDLAYRYAARLERPTLVMVGGLMGTGKSTLAAAIAEPLGAKVIRTDVVRKRLAGVPETEHHFDDFGSGLYSGDMTERTYAAALEEAIGLLRAGGSAIVDASWSRKAQRERAARAAADQGAAAVFVECVCPEDVVRERLEARMTQDGEPSDGRWDIYALQRDAYESVTADEGLRTIVLDCARPLEDCAHDAVTKLRALEWDRGGERSG